MDDEPATVFHLFPGQGDPGLDSVHLAATRSTVLRDALEETFEEVLHVARAEGLDHGGSDPHRWRTADFEQLASGPAGLPQLLMYATAVAVHRALIRTAGPPAGLIAVSFGEIAALTAARALTVADGTRVVCRATGAFRDSPAGVNTVLCASWSEVTALLARTGRPDVVIACENSPRETVVCGSAPDVTEVERAATSAGLRWTRLPLPFLSHHPALAPHADAFARAIAETPFRPCRIPVHSAVARRVYTSDEDLAAALARCLVHPVRLPDTLRSAVGAGPAVIFDTGGRGGAARAAHRCLTDLPARAVTPVRDPEHPWEPRTDRSA
ncbi:acyltransferase domain-containing protein (plasmid) [Streptomyces sp. BI20]|uniref:acyltransferase domain-containing protein n=1 Tax=Streptomyces sp. BI20 TaxID=3403460 RepID=UPI003C76BA2B